MRSMRRDCGRSRRSTPATSRGRASGRSTRCECRFRTTPTSRATPTCCPPTPTTSRSRPSSPESIRSAPAPNSTTTRSRRSSAATPPTHRSPTCVSRTSTARSNTSPRRIFPLQLTKWWTLNANLTGICRRDRITADAPLRTTWAAFANAATTFTLPRKFFIEAEYYAMSRFRQANLDMKSYHSVTLSLKKTPAGQPSDTHGAGSEPLRPFAAVRGRDRNLRTRPAGIQRLAAPPLRTDGQLQLQDRQVVQGPQGRERRRRRKKGRM